MTVSEAEPKKRFLSARILTARPAPSQLPPRYTMSEPICHILKLTINRRKILTVWHPFVFLKCLWEHQLGEFIDDKITYLSEVPNIPDANDKEKEGNPSEE